MKKKLFYDILATIAKKYEFEYPDDKLIVLSRASKKWSMIKQNILIGHNVKI